MPDNYAEVLDVLKSEVRCARTRAALAANTELVKLYLAIGRRIAEQGSAWGERTVTRLADDLRRAFSDMKGFSRANLFNMRRAWLVWADAPEPVQQLVGLIPWGHHILVCTRVTDPDARAFCLRATVEHGWSRAILGLQVDMRLHERRARSPSWRRLVPPQVLRQNAPDRLAERRARLVGRPIPSQSQAWEMFIQAFSHALGYEPVSRLLAGEEAG